MIGLIAAALAVSGAVVIELALPGQAVYHAGWYNVLVAALVVGNCVAARRYFARVHSTRGRVAIVTMLSGTVIVGLAGVASGLLAPDNQTFVGAPAERLRVESLGLLVFPLAAGDARASRSVILERPFRASAKIVDRAGNMGNFIVWTQSRSVVYAEARDLRGNRLTITQPTGAAFLSPVLLMEHRQTIAEMELPYDSFNVPALRRVVKVVLFTPAQAAMLLHGGAELGKPAVLFAVDDENERPLPHAIALSAGGRDVRVGGLNLRAVVETYPAVEVVAAPNLFATALGALLVVAGVIALILP